MSRALSQFCFLIACSLTAWAQSAPVPAAIILLKPARIIDVRTGRLLTGQAILIEGERIKEVGPASALTQHATARAVVIDLPTSTVLPGLIDCHAHLLGNLRNLSPVQPLRISSAQGTLWGFHNLQEWLAHGFTALRDAGESDTGYGQLALRDSIDSGLIPGPRMVSAGNYISVTGGHGDADLLAPDQALAARPNLADSTEQVAVAVRHDIKYGADWIKLMATGGVQDVFSDFNTQELSEEQMAKAVEVAHRARKHVMAHAEGADGIKAAVRAGVDSIEHGTMLDDEGAALMAKRGTWLVPTLETFQHGAAVGTSTGQEEIEVAKTKAILKYQKAAFQRALANHVKIAFGVDDNPDFLAKEFPALVAGGMSPLQALQSATIHAAELLGMSDQAGSLEPGKYADIIAVGGDPLTDITILEKVVFVMKGGVVMKNISGGLRREVR